MQHVLNEIMKINKQTSFKTPTKNLSHFEKPALKQNIDYNSVDHFA